MSRRYLLISPCRDEADYLQVTIDSVAAQTVLPTKWIIVDDGSSDDTPKILERAAKQYPYIQAVRRDDRGRRAVGPGVIDAFYHGLSHAHLGDYDYVCKFDADLKLGRRYFERSIEHFEADPWLGTISGKLELHFGEKVVLERIGDEDSVGAVKFYRVACFEDIGGFVRGVCWDGIDGHMCRLKGWIARSVDEPELRINHLRQMGSSQTSIWHGRMRWGRGKYFNGIRTSLRRRRGFVSNARTPLHRRRRRHPLGLHQGDTRPRASHGRPGLSVSASEIRAQLARARQAPHARARERARAKATAQGRRPALNRGRR